LSDSRSKPEKLKKVIIYTDGAAVPNPGKGGYGVVLRFGKHCKELSGGYARTTNNRMELMAVIVGLESLKQRCKVILHSDSQYVVNAITSGSVFKWRANGWAVNASRSKPVKNADLWERLLCAYEKHEVEMVWVRGHAGIENNERCDRLAMSAIERGELPPDAFYDATVRETPRKTRPARGEIPESKTKITQEGQPCRKCQTPVVKRSPKKKGAKASQSYYYEWYLYCPNCRTMYMVDEAKREVRGDSGPDLFAEDA